MKKIGFVLPILALALMLGTATSALAQNVGDNSVYFVTYFANNTAANPDETVRFINDGDTGGDLWASFYVFDDSEELSECCSCAITPDGLLSESVQKELTNNPLSGAVRTRGVIKVIASSTSDPTATKPTAGLHGWATHVQAGKVVTETGVADANLSSAEQSLLQNLCYYAQVLGSGAGSCSCTAEDHDF
jgi:hypothetical protein